MEVRVPRPLDPPTVIHVDWQPYDSGVAPASFRRDWPTGGDLGRGGPGEHLPPRRPRAGAFRAGQRRKPTLRLVRFRRVRIRPDASGWLLAEDGGSDRQPFEYTHTSLFPTGEPANLLAVDEPLPAVPALVGVSADGPAGGWPSILLAMYRDIAADRPLWTKLRRLKGASDEGIGEFARVPQVYLQYAHEPDLRAIARCSGTACSPFVVGQLVSALAEQDANDDQALVAHWASASDGELDRWLGAAASGASLAG